MYIVIFIIAIIIFLLVLFFKKYKRKIKFFVIGLESKFSISEINLLWHTAKVCSLPEPLSLYWSLPSLTRCISEIKYSVDTNASNSSDMKYLLSKLYAHRTRIEKEADKKRGIENTRLLDSGQRLRIIFPGKGVFSSKIVNNKRELTISLPTRDGKILFDSKQWGGKTISVYLWRTGDARYVFDTAVIGEGIFLGHPVLFLRHTDKLLRTQKRQTIRTKCSIYGEMFIIREKIIDYNSIETNQGYRCLIEDISESGAMIRVGGKGLPNIQIKLQFMLEDKLIVMFGIVRTVEYNKEINQSRLHFECIHIDTDMKNNILSFVYNIMTPSEREIYDALSLTNNDILSDDIDISEYLNQEVQDGENIIEENYDEEINEEEIDESQQDLFEDYDIAENENNIEKQDDSNFIKTTDEIIQNK